MTVTHRLAYQSSFFRLFLISSAAINQHSVHKAKEYVQNKTRGLDKLLDQTITDAKYFSVSKERRDS